MLTCVTLSARPNFAIAAALSLFCAAGAEAIDAPRWVAALHIAAQKANGLRWNPVPGASGYKRAEGAGSTMLTGPQGVSQDALSLGKNTLLGG